MYRLVTTVSVLLLALPALGQFDSGSDGTDGALDCAAFSAMDSNCNETCSSNCTVEIHLAAAATAAWDTPVAPENAGQGVYDAEKWAVVYKYTTIDIPERVTVTFVNHLKGAPVIWLASGNVTIAGNVRLNGASGSNIPAYARAIPGPGGFSGGIARFGKSAGFGPGGGEFGNDGGGGGYGTPGQSSGGAGGVVYGTDSIDPLIGGSGGGADSTSTYGGGAGGGAILIASSGDITLDSTGEIFALGGNGPNGSGCGSGGGIRLIANNISGLGVLQALGATSGGPDGGDGRIRLEAPTPDEDINLDQTLPPYTVGVAPDSVFPPPEAPAPILRVATIHDVEVPTDPLATVATGDVAFTSVGSVFIEIELLHLPEAVGSIVEVRIVQADGGFSEVVFSNALADDGKGGLAATAEVDFSSHASGKWEVQLSLARP